MDTELAAAVSVLHDKIERVRYGLMDIRRDNMAALRRTVRDDITKLERSGLIEMIGYLEGVIRGNDIRAEVMQGMIDDAYAASTFLSGE